MCPCMAPPPAPAPAPAAEHRSTAVKVMEFKRYPSHWYGNIIIIDHSERQEREARGGRKGRHAEEESEKMCNDLLEMKIEWTCTTRYSTLKNYMNLDK